MRIQFDVSPKVLIMKDADDLEKTTQEAIKALKSLIDDGITKRKTFSKILVTTFAIIIIVSEGWHKALLFGFGIPGWREQSPATYSNALYALITGYLARA